MDEVIYDDITGDLLYIVRFIRKHLLKADFEKVEQKINSPHLGLMDMLRGQGALPVSEIGKRMLIPKPQMTHLVDKLIKLNLVSREPDSNDRRVINISLTEKGERTLMECRKLIRENVKNKLSYLGDSGLIGLSGMLKNLRNIGEALE